MKAYSLQKELQFFGDSKVHVGKEMTYPRGWSWVQLTREICLDNDIAN